MRRSGTVGLALLFLAAATGSTALRAAEPSSLPETQREASRILSAMAKYLAGLGSFSVRFRDGYDVVQSTGQKIEFGERRDVVLVRPDRLRVEESSGDGRRDVAVFDGRTISVFDADAGVYAQAAQPGNVDDAIVYYVRGLGMRMPLALLLSSRLPVELPARVKAVDYVEATDVGGVRAHHIAGRTESVDFQFWIEDGARPLPLRVVITYIQSPGQPQFWADFSDWNTDPRPVADAFTFRIPPDARKVPFAVQLRPVAAGNAEQAQGVMP